MIVQVDTREKAEKIGHIREYFDAHNIKYIRTKMYVGDYCSFEQPSVVVERKQNLLELANNATKGHGRFKTELRRLDEIKGKMYILVEENINSLADVRLWVSKHTRLDGNTLFKILDSWQYKHNIEYVFCHKNSVGKKIIELLTRH